MKNDIEKMKEIWENKGEKNQMKKGMKAMDNENTNSEEESGKKWKSNS